MNAVANARKADVQMLDTTIVRVHQHGGCAKRTARSNVGRSRGGLTTKIHALVDGKGLPIRLALSAGQNHDSGLATDLLDGLASDCLFLADRAYDSDAIREFVRMRGA